ncbi:MAG: chorismate-binding protein [Kiritimatiellia bacterium]
MNRKIEEKDRQLRRQQEEIDALKQAVKSLLDAPAPCSMGDLRDMWSSTGAAARRGLGTALRHRASCARTAWRRWRRCPGGRRRRRLAGSVAGFVAYEAALAFDRARDPRPAGPLAWFLAVRSGQRPPRHIPPHPPAGPAAPDWRGTRTRTGSRRASPPSWKIAAGETYQVNATHRLRAGFRGDPWALFLDRLLVQPAPHAAFLDLGDLAVCSWSPELFFHQQGSTVTCRPMKGTGAATAEPSVLRGSEKDRAENIMIVDMVRNDLGHIAHPGSVRAEPLFTVETYRTVQQMTSTVTAGTDEAWPGVFRALFPCASVTGAPKVQTMRIIRELEDTPRKVYTGAIGCAFGPRDAEFNVAIRTAVVAGGAAEYGVGSGIVWDSTAAEEWSECAGCRMLGKRPPEVRSARDPALEPFRRVRAAGGPSGAPLRSAAFFNCPVDRRAVDRALARAADTWPRADMRGAAAGGSRRRPPRRSRPPAPRPTAPAGGADDRPVCTADPFLYHKTTHRAVYDEFGRAIRTRTTCCSGMRRAWRANSSSGTWPPIWTGAWSRRRFTTVCFPACGGRGNSRPGGSSKPTFPSRPCAAPGRCCSSTRSGAGSRWICSRTPRRRCC